MNSFVRASVPGDEHETALAACAFPLVLPDKAAPGLTKRELFAAMAMQGLCSGEHWPRNDDGPVMAEKSVNFADALLAELAK